MSQTKNYVQSTLIKSKHKAEESDGTRDQKQIPSIFRNFLSSRHNLHQGVTLETSVNNVLPKVTVFPRVNFLHLAKKLSVRDRVAALEKRLKDTAAIDDIVDFGTSKLTPANGSTFILSI